MVVYVIMLTRIFNKIDAHTTASQRWAETQKQLQFMLYTGHLFAFPTFHLSNETQNNNAGTLPKVFANATLCMCECDQWPSYVIHIIAHGMCQ